ncbi:MAG: preprotein translocase subunit SecE [Bacteroidetes bacterium]|nr:MAG: preprotein translocase subunit SecE [Bacteroidota bacterium]
MMKIKGYLKEAYTELVKKVTWPSWSELQNSAIVVMIASFIIAVVVYLMDISFSFIMEQIYKMV